MSRRLTTLGATLTLMACGSTAEPLPELGQVPELSMRDHEGAPFTDQNLRGQVSVVSFVFTRCPSVCPLISERSKGVLEELSGDPGIQLVTFTVDPEYDTPEVLREYRGRYGAGPRWVHVTGESRDLAKAVARGFRTAVGDPTPVADGEGFDILHSSHFVLVDQGGEIRGFYRSSDAPEVQRLLGDARALAD